MVRGGRALQRAELVPGGNESLCISISASVGKKGNGSGILRGSADAIEQARRFWAWPSAVRRSGGGGGGRGRGSAVSGRDTFPKKVFSRVRRLEDQQGSGCRKDFLGGKKGSATMKRRTSG